MRTIRSMYWKNISTHILHQQKRVLASLGYDVMQCEADQMPHGAWLTQTLEDAAEDEVILFLDIDAFPLESSIVERAFSEAEAGKVIGVAQTANHLPNREFIYAAPAFLAIARKTWVQQGKPDLINNREGDAGMALSIRAKALNIPVEIIYPNFVCIPLWRLSNRGVVGVATFYENVVFHLFESRKHTLYQVALDYVADCVVEKKPIDYLWLYQHLNSDKIKRAQIQAEKKAKAKRKREKFINTFVLRNRAS